MGERSRLAPAGGVCLGLAHPCVRSAVIEEGETIERYPQDTPYPSRLLLGFVGGRPLHVVVADNSDDGETIVVTAYEPDRALWHPGFRRRRRS